MKETLLTVSVIHTEPLQIGDTTFHVSYQMRLRVETESGIGIGYSEPVVLEIQAEKLSDLYHTCFTLQGDTERKLRKMELEQAIVAFPTLLRELAPA